MMAQLVLCGAVVIIFMVALVIINNAVMMATLQRVQEVGTMRAIGAQRSFILSMVLVETLVLGLVFGGLGAGVGSGSSRWSAQVGHPRAATRRCTSSSPARGCFPPGRRQHHRRLSSWSW